MDPLKLRDSWHILCLDLDKLLPDSLTQRLKLTSLSITAPGSKLYDISAVYVSLKTAKRNMKVSQSIENMEGLGKKAAEEAKEQTATTVVKVKKRRSATNTSQMGSYTTSATKSVNSRQYEYSTKTPVSSKQHTELPPLLGNELNVIHERP